MSRQLNRANVESTRQSTLVLTKSVQKPITGSSFQSFPHKSGYKFGSASASKQTSSFDNEGKKSYHKEARRQQMKKSNQEDVETVRIISDKKDKEMTRHLEASTYLNIRKSLVNGFNKPKSQMKKNLKNLESMTIKEQVCRKQLMQHHLSLIEATELLDLNADPEILKQAMDQLFQENIVRPSNEIEVWVEVTDDSDSTRGKRRDWNKIIGRDNIINAKMDSYFQYLRNIQDKPVPVQISIGATGGFVTSYFLTRVSKFFAAIAGVSMIVIQFFNYRGYIAFQRNQFQRDLDYLAGSVRTPEDLIPTARSIDGFILKHCYLIGGFIAGSLIGYSYA